MATIKKATEVRKGKAILHLFNVPGKTSHPMSKERFDFIRPLLDAQPYIKEVVYDGNDAKHDSSINGFRNHGAMGRNLADMHLGTHGWEWEERAEAWLSVSTKVESSPPKMVLIARTFRYHNQLFPWKCIVKRYGNGIGFMGLPEEHKAFTERFGPVDFFKPKDALQMASWINSCRLFFGNQSLAAAIAEGLKHPGMVVESYPKQANCQFHRIGRVDLFDDRLELPEI